MGKQLKKMSLIYLIVNTIWISYCSNCKYYPSLFRWLIQAKYVSVSTNRIYELSYICFIIRYEKCNGIFSCFRFCLMVNHSEFQHNIKLFHVFNWFMWAYLLQDLHVERTELFLYYAKCAILFQHTNFWNHSFIGLPVL